MSSASRPRSTARTSATSCFTSRREWTASIGSAPRAGIDEQHDGRPNGTLASLDHLIGRANLYRYVRPGAMVLNSRGIDGARIFRVVDWTLFAVVTEPVKEALEAAQVSGVEFPQVNSS